ncbi:hypothetical protein RB628_32310 [Streptomyces sp. ADMS]|nr:hypothetical protein [Streptomyces sp. ADMS]MDW4909890.1 hypothetical protein [Streptomyces sp. ADMS]
MDVRDVATQPGTAPSTPIDDAPPAVSRRLRLITINLETELGTRCS